MKKKYLLYIGIIQLIFLQNSFSGVLCNTWILGINKTCKNMYPSHTKSMERCVHILDFALSQSDSDCTLPRSAYNNIKMVCNNENDLQTQKACLGALDAHARGFGLRDDRNFDYLEQNNKEITEESQRKIDQCQANCQKNYEKTDNFIREYAWDHSVYLKNIAKYKTKKEQCDKACIYDNRVFKPIKPILWVVQAGAFKSLERAKKSQKILNYGFKPTKLISKNDWHILQLPAVPTKQEAELQLNRLKDYFGIKGLIKPQK